MRPRWSAKRQMNDAARCRDCRYFTADGDDVEVWCGTKGGYTRGSLRACPAGKQKQESQGEESS